MATISSSQIRKHSKADIIAGLTVAILVIPQAMGYAQIAGLPPILGLYTAFIPLLIYPLFGTSPHIIVGCAAIPSMMLFSSIAPMAEPFSPEYVKLAMLMTFLVGACLLILRLVKFGRLATLISRPVIYGYTCGAAILIIISQIRYMLKANVEDGASNFEYFSSLLSQLQNVEQISALVGLATLVVILIARKVNKKFPIALVVLLFGIALVYYLGLDKRGVDVVKEIPAGLPSFSIPALEWKLILKLLPYALLIALVSYVQSYAIARTFSMEDSESNLEGEKELFALGAMNLVSSFFQCFPSTGSLTKSAVNFEAGSKTGFASIVAGSIVALVLLFFTDLFYYLPKAILAAIIMVAVLKFIDFKGMRSVLASSKLDFCILIITLFITLFFNIQMGVFVGILLSLLSGIYRIESLNQFVKIFRLETEVAKIDNDCVYLLSPIIYTNSDFAYAIIKSKIEESGAKFLNEGNIEIDSEGRQVLDRLIKEYSLDTKLPN